MSSMCDQTFGIDRTADHVIRIALPEHPPVACARVAAGDTVILPFENLDDMWMVDVDGYLVIGDEGATIFLEGFEQAFRQGFEKSINETGIGGVVVAERDGTPIDIAVVLASTFPNLDITP